MTTVSLKTPPWHLPKTSGFVGAPCTALSIQGAPGLQQDQEGAGHEGGKQLGALDLGLANHRPRAKSRLPARNGFYIFKLLGRGGETSKEGAHFS